MTHYNLAVQEGDGGICDLGIQGGSGPAGSHPGRPAIEDAFDMFSKPLFLHSPKRLAESLGDQF